ncbi:MAG TPA: PAS domain-containing protein [Candidatus Limnocylindrales bacterium]|nr:PAS domain-containing protein [Candidatus Limnocylindrales bacterium]
MGTSSIADRLAAWRAAARRWDAAPDQDPTSEAGREVVRAWLAYQEAAAPTADDEFLLAADDKQRYIAATAGVERVLGYSPADVLNMTIADLAAPDVRDRVSSSWARFVDDGSQEGEFALRAADGRVVPVTFRARVNHPIPGVYVSRLRPLSARNGNAAGKRPAPLLG